MPVFRVKFWITVKENKLIVIGTQKDLNRTLTNLKNAGYQTRVEGVKKETV